MLFAYNTDGTLEVLTGIDQARRQYDRSDLDTGAIRIFDEHGTPLVAVFPPGGTRGGLAGGEQFDLVPGAHPDGESFEQVLDEAYVLMRNPWFADLDAVKRHVGARARR